MQMSELQAKSNNNLALCPFCGGEASVKVLEYDDDCKVWGVFCESDLESEYSHGHFVDNYPTEAEAIAAWNSRAAMEFDNWFYLPKPKEPIVEVAETTHAWDGTKVKTNMFYQVQEQAVIDWAKELDEHIIKRICEVWNSRAERTCENVGYYIDDTRFKCSECGYNGWTKWAKDGEDRIPGYCPNCGAKVVGE